MIYSRTEASNRDGENDVVEPVERRERERERERETVRCRQLFTLKVVYPYCHKYGNHIIN